MRNYTNILKAVERTGVRAWLVGDTVHMIEMGLEPELLTLALDSDDLSDVASALGLGTVDVRGPYPVLRGELEGVPFRGFCLQGGSIEEDLARRDFSIEAIALRSDGGVVDPFGGRLDIRNRVVRLTGDDIELIHKDPLRIIRMLRFAAELEMDIFWKTDADVRKFLDTNSESMGAIPAERWGREIIVGMKRRPWRFIQLCDAYGLLPFFLKDLDDLKAVPDEEGSARTLFDHVMRTLQVIESRLDTSKLMQGDAFVLAGLFSRIGTTALNAKGGKKSEEDQKKKQARLVSEYLTKWNIPSETINDVAAIISYYASFYEPVSEEQFCTAVLKFGMNAVGVALEFALCIALAEGFSHGEVLEDNQWNLAQVLRRFRSVARQTEGATRFLSGDEVMKLLKLGPGRVVGKLLKDLDVAVGTGKVSSRAAAEAWLMNNAPAS